MREGVDRADRQSRYESLIKAPTGEMAKAAEDAARYYTFQKELGVAGQAVQNMSNKVPGLKLVIPFVRTPANIVKFAGERSVFGVAMSDRWVSFSRFDPLSMLAGVAADFVEAGHSAKPQEADKLAVHLTLGIAKNLTSKTWLSGAADFFQMLDDPDRYGDRYFRNLAATAAVPSILNQTAQAIDPNLRDARTLMDAIKVRTPGLSQSVMPRRDMWGEPITRGDSVGPDFLSPLYATNVMNDPLRAEVARLRVPVSMPQRDVMIDGERVPLDPAQYDEYQRVSGAAAGQSLRDAMRSPTWSMLTDAQRSDYVRSAFSNARKRGGVR